MKQRLGFAPPRDPAATAAVFARVPVEEARKLDRAAYESGRSKREIVASLLSSLGSGPLELGRAEVATASSEVLTLDEAAALLRVEPSMLEQIVARGDVPARRIGADWRFSRQALLDWLAGGEAGGATRERPARRGATSGRSGASRR